MKKLIKIEKKINVVITNFNNKENQNNWLVGKLLRYKDCLNLFNLFKDL